MEIVGSNPGKGEDFSKKIWIWILTKKAPILRHDVDVSPYDKGYKLHTEVHKEIVTCNM